MRRALSRLSVTGALLAILFPDPGPAQVRIHEVVDIVDTLGHGPAAYDNWVVASADGFVTVALENVDHIDWPIDSSSVLTVTVRDTVFRMPAMRYASGSREASAYIRDLCNGLQVRWVPSYFRERNLQTDSVLRVPVCAGDSVKVAYTSGVAADRARLAGDEDSWRIELSRTHPCYIYTGCSPCPPIHVIYAAASVAFEYPIKILLGESKYFEVVPAPPPRTIRIKAISSPDSVSSSRIRLPSYSLRQLSGRLPALYVDTRLPVYSVSTQGQTIFAAMQQTPSGVLRVIGRHWNRDTAYIFWLRATHESFTDSLMIVVDRPDSLGDTSRRVRDVLENLVDLDSLLINLGGRTGIPPQVLKAIVSQESSFLPQARYEPFRDARLQRARDATIANSHYAVTATSNGNPLPPQNHRFRRWGEWRSTYLPVYQGTIAQVFRDHQSSYPPALYGLEGTWRRRFFDPCLDSLRRTWPRLTNTELLNMARESANARWLEYLADEFEGGMSQYVAQIRTLSSYGFMQMMYYDAVVDRGYGQNDRSLPEYIMLTDTNLTYGSNHLNSRFSHWGVAQNRLESGYWPVGFEGTFERVLRAYNGWSENNPYGRLVLGQSLSYPPRKR